MGLIAGLDDAGRGPVIGPMVIAGVMIHEEREHELKKIGVKDSKLMTRSRRQFLFDEICRLSEGIHYDIVKPNRIDEYVKRKRRLEGLNLLEAEVMADVIEKLKPNMAIVDASDIDEQRFGETVSEYLKSDVKVVSRHRADRKYPIVSAASIIAKVIRDREISKLKQHYGDFGSGYPADEKTINFLNEYYRRNKRFPLITRLSWKTIKNIEDSFKQNKLY